MHSRTRPSNFLRVTLKTGSGLGTRLPDYKVSSSTQNKWQLQKAQEEILTRLRQDLNDRKAVKTATKYYVSLPSEEAHHKSHKTGGMHAMAQRVHPKVIMKIHELVGAGISEVLEVKRALNLYIIKELCSTNHPTGMTEPIIRQIMIIFTKPSHSCSYQNLTKKTSV